MAVALVMGNMIGSGIFLLPASLAPYGGGLSLAGWLVSTAGALALALVFARLSRLHPAAGGPYAFTRRAFGDLAGFLVAWGYWISIWTALAALAVALVGYLAAFVPGLAHTPLLAAAVAVAAIWAAILVNAAGVRTAGWVQAVTTALKILPLVGVAVAGVLHFEPSHFGPGEAAGASPMAALPAVVTLTLWAFLGLESATIPAESIDDPQRTIPRATVVGTLLSAALYVASTVGVMSLVHPSQLAVSEAPFADAARVLGGHWAASAVAAGAAMSCLGALNGWTLLAGQQGLFPGIFARLSARGTPAAGLLIAGALTTGLVSLNYTRGLVELFTFIILLSTLSALIPYVFVSLAAFVLHDGAAVSRPGAGPATAAAIAFLYSMWAIGGAGKDAVYWGFLLLLSGLPVYVLLIGGSQPIAGHGDRRPPPASTSDNVRTRVP